jgi:hypothetical protein
LKYVGALERGFAYLSWCNSGWFCHTFPPGKSKCAKKTRPPKAPENPLAMVNTLVNLQDPILENLENLATPANTLVGLQDL